MTRGAVRKNKRAGAPTSGSARMVARDPREAHRAATPLELFFDLVFVVAIAQAAAGLHHAIAASHAASGLLAYLMVFFAIWWAWMNFTWFASAYDSGDIPYRLAVFVKMSGALILAAGIPAMFETGVPNGATVGGYVVMRLAMVGQWLRAAASDRERRVTARRYAIGITVLQVAWAAMLLAPRYWGLGFPVLAALELAVPVWAESAAMTTWHPHHIAERYGLLTLIVLGESVLAATLATQAALASGETLSALAPLIAGGLLIVYSMWWVYFDRPVHDLLTGLGTAIVWGYGHYLVFASAAAVGAGLAVAIDQARQQAAIGDVAAGSAVAVPIAVYLLSLWFLHDRPEYGAARSLGPVAALLVLLTPLTGQPVLSAGMVLVALIAVKGLLVRRRARAAGSAPA